MTVNLTARLDEATQGTLSIAGTSIDEDAVGTLLADTSVDTLAQL